jgi:hypothetical protein
LKNEQSPDLFGNDVERERGVAQVIENAHEPDQIVRLVGMRQFIHLCPPKRDSVRQLELFGGPAGLSE